MDHSFNTVNNNDNNMVDTALESMCEKCFLEPVTIVNNAHHLVACVNECTKKNKYYHGTYF